MDTKELISLMKELKSDNSIAFKNLNNAVMYWALAEEHPFKKAIRESFSVNQTLFSPEIQTILVPIAKYHLHKVLMPRKYISLFKSMYKTDRPRNQYVIRGENPLQLKEHKDRIAPEENNLLRFFNPLSIVSRLWVVSPRFLTNICCSLFRMSIGAHYIKTLL